MSLDNYYYQHFVYCILDNKSVQSVYDSDLYELLYMYLYILFCVNNINDILY